MEVLLLAHSTFPSISGNGRPLVLLYPLPAAQLICYRSGQSDVPDFTSRERRVDAPMLLKAQSENFKNCLLFKG
jgi:hypothetical protein